VMRATWRRGNFFEICNAASLWLLGVAAARQGDTPGFFIF
jgi:hypothetical protein